MLTQLDMYPKDAVCATRTAELRQTASKSDLLGTLIVKFTTLRQIIKRASYEFRSKLSEIGLQNVLSPNS